MCVRKDHYGEYHCGLYVYEKTRGTEEEVGSDTAT